MKTTTTVQLKPGSAKIKKCIYSKENLVKLLKLKHHPTKKILGEFDIHIASYAVTEHFHF